NRPRRPAACAELLAARPCGTTGFTESDGGLTWSHGSDRGRSRTPYRERPDENRVLHRESAAARGRRLAHARPPLHRAGSGGDRFPHLCSVRPTARNLLAEAYTPRPVLRISALP